MKKIILLLITIILLTGCTNVTNEFEIGELTNIELVDKGVTLSLKEGTLTNKGATFILKNTSENNYTYGEPYYLEIKKDGKWHEINVKAIFNMPAYNLDSNTSKEIKITWEYNYGKLAKGEYRLIKDLIHDIEPEDNTYEKFYVAAEFTIK